MISINVLLTTIGREELKTRMLPSVVNQLNENDYLTVISDINHRFVSECLSEFNFKCTVSHIMNNVQLGFWGHGSRTKYQNNLLGDFIMNADDDDRYVDNAFDVVRNIALDKNTLYLFRVKNQEWLSWETEGLIKVGKIGTASGIIPNNQKLPCWDLENGGDGKFYEKISKIMPYKFVDYVIYKVRETE